jgi:dipeptidyl aminopeptidase/acylaminoacyl peptidase
LKKLSVAFALMSTLSLAFHASAQVRRLSADDLQKVVRITDPQFSPDGKTVAILVGRANMKDDRWDTEIDLVDLASRELRVMTHERVGVGSAKWSPTGDRIAFLAQDVNKKAQIFILPVAGGDAMQLTHSKTPISLIAWKPDGTTLAYAAVDEEPEKKDEAKFEDGFEVGNNNYLERTATLPVHLWTVTTIDGQAKRLTQGAWSLPGHLAPAGPPSQIAFTPDGNSVVFVKADSPITGESQSSRLAKVDIATGRISGITTAAVAESNPVLSPDGTKIAYSFPRDGKKHNQGSVYVVPTAGGTATDVAYALDRDTNGAAWMPDGQSLVTAGNDETTVHMWLLPMGGKPKLIDLTGLTPSPGMAVSKGGEIAFAATTANHPAELFYLPHLGDTPVQLTHLQHVTDGVEVGKSETVKWKSDKFDVDGVLTYPPDYAAGKKYPLVLFIHGGPTAASLETLSMPAQIFAAQGWLVFEPNYRGSNNMGNAFTTSIVADAGAGPGRDVMAGVAALEKRGIVDETRIAVSGWSYGGYMTSWLIGNYPTVWKAAVAGAPVTDIVDQYTLSDNNIQRASGYGPSPFVGEKSLQRYAAMSPLTYAWRVKAPTLILSDVGDWRVTTTPAYKLMHALKDNNVPVKFVAYPVPGHFPADPIRARDVYRRWTAWLATYLNSATPTNATGN